MQDPLQALGEISAFLTEHHIPHFVIGGIANVVWGRPRVTLDADLKILLPLERLKPFVEQIGKQFRFRVSDPLAFAQELFVVLVQSSAGVDIDLIIGVLPYEQTAYERVQWLTFEGITFPICSAEDLIVHKAISERPQDWLDIEGVLQRQQEKLDQKYILHWLTEFSALLENPEIVSKYKRALALFL